ncbi:MAG: hypothetical protein GXW96_05160 [Christensenellaceae bacterium]|nr:hypothetical protein [Christensenellaceae bacterium]
MVYKIYLINILFRYLLIVFSKRTTSQRSSILETVKEYRSHVTADEVCEAIVKQCLHISRAVYRNMILLSENGGLRKVECHTRPSTPSAVGSFFGAGSSIYFLSMREKNP